MRSKDMEILLTFVLMAMCFSAVQAEVQYLDFVVEETVFTRLCSSKSMLVVNGSFPGPVIRVHKGDIVYVNVHNRGTFGITLHWHGVMQPRNPWFDGPEYITQCAIPAGSNFTYEVNFTTEEGTVWWHAHSDWTRASVHGAIVVYPTEGTTHPFPQPDADEVLVLGSWYIDNYQELVDYDMAEGSDLPTSDAYTINGQPGDFCSCSNDSTYRWYVDYGKTYQVRIVNADMNAELFVAIAGHNLKVVGMDGGYVKPFVTDYVMISPGQTIDALLVANQSLGYYYIVARQYYSGKLLYTEFGKTNASAILQYRGNYTPPEEPEFPVHLPSYYDIDAQVQYTQKLRSLADVDHPALVPLNISTRMFLTASINMMWYHSERIAASLSNISWVNPRTDVLSAYYRNLSGFYTTDFPDQPPTYFDFTGDALPVNTTVPIQGTKVKVLNYGEEVEMVFQGTNILNSSVNHPMHLHGHTFYVVGSGGGNYDAETDPRTFNLIDPPRLNTISIPRNGWVAVRFKATNPGVWLWHCHLDRHFTWGMNTVLIVKDGGTPETSLKPPPSYMPDCGPAAVPTLELQAFSDHLGTDTN